MNFQHFQVQEVLVIITLHLKRLLEVLQIGRSLGFPAEQSARRSLLLGFSFRLVFLVFGYFFGPFCCGRLCIGLLYCFHTEEPAMQDSNLSLSPDKKRGVGVGTHALGFRVVGNGEGAGEFSGVFSFWSSENNSCKGG